MTHTKLHNMQIGGEVKSWYSLFAYAYAAQCWSQRRAKLMKASAAKWSY